MNSGAFKAGAFAIVELCRAAAAFLVVFTHYWANDPAAPKWWLFTHTLESLVSEGKAVGISKGGYPSTYLLAAEHVSEFLLTGQMPAYKGYFVVGEDYVDAGGNTWGLEVDSDKANFLRSGDMLVVEAWDS